LKERITLLGLGGAVIAFLGTALLVLAS